MQDPELIHEGHFEFDREDPIYAHHFPGNPVVPGSLIIDAFMTAAGTAVAMRGRWLVENFRFRRFISPGRYAFRIQSQADGSKQCVLYDSGSKVAAGTLRERV